MGKIKQLHLDCEPGECTANMPLECPMQYEDLIKE